MKKLFFLAIMAFTLVCTVNAQQKFTWKQYGLSFSVPSNFKVLENTAESFEAENQNIHLAIQVLDYDGISEEIMGEILGEMAVEAGMDTDFADIGELQLTTLAGAYIEGPVNGVRVSHKGTLFFMLMRLFFGVCEL